MTRNSHLHLTRRERQIMDSLYRREAATAADVLEDLPDPPSYSAVRAMLAKLEAKGHVEHQYDGPRYLYRPTMPRDTARETALARLVDTFFEGSAASTIAALLDRASADLDEGELDRLSELIEDARQRGR
jgi:predicted transcriptional regulator